MFLVPDTAWKFGCGRFIQGEDAVTNLRNEVLRIGNSALVLSGFHSLNALSESYPGILDTFPNSLYQYTGPCCEKTARFFAEEMRKKQEKVVVGIGGGKIMDLAKLVAELAGKKVINVPTITATCAAYTPMSIVYTPEGCSIGTWFFETEPACVISDTTLLAKQPKRYAIAGIVDSMAKSIEISHYTLGASTGIDMKMAQHNADYIFSYLTEMAPAIPAALDAGIPSQLISDMAFLTIASTGYVSGSAKGRQQSAQAHDLYYAIRTSFTKQCAQYLHGEIVGIGLRLQLAYDGRPLEPFDEVMKKIGGLMHLRDIGLAENRETYSILTDCMLHLHHAQGSGIDPDKLIDAFFRIEV